MREEYIKSLENAFKEECYEVISKCAVIRDVEVDRALCIENKMFFAYWVELKIYKQDDCLIIARGNEFQDLWIIYKNELLCNVDISENIKSKIRKVIAEYIANRN